MGGDYTARFIVPETKDRRIATLLHLRQDNPVVEWLSRQGKPLFRESLDILPEFSNLWAEEVQAIDAAEIELFAPLLSRGNLVGILALSRKEPASAYDMSDIELISVFTHSIAAAIENAELHARIETFAITDVLTGLFNRRHFDERLIEEIGRHSRYGGSFSLILFDLDHFKNYNDTYGHGAGDELLRQVGRTAKGVVRNVDLVFRYGGDEFAVLLPQTPPDHAYAVGERLRNRLAMEMQAKSTGVNVSLGIASWPADGMTPSDIVRAADKALYHVKRAGGNAVSLFSEISSSLVDYPVVRRDDDKAALSAAYALVAAVDAKDHYTARHSRAVTTYAIALAQAVELPPEKIAVLKTATLLHDVGKIGIPDSLLSKNGKLTPEEWETIKTHSSLGTNIISHVPSLASCLPIILHHHEHYNGRGYPDGLKGEAIPLEARILAIADAFASMTSVRPYRRALSYSEAIEELKRCSGTQFDPGLVTLFISKALLLANTGPVTTEDSE
jgi:diguanylate cyclase (GGDEF)-like protein